MEAMLERCAGIDIGKDEVVACVRTPAPEGKGRIKQSYFFGITPITALSAIARKAPTSLAK